MIRLALLFLFTICIGFSNLAYSQNGLNSNYTCVVAQERNYFGGVGFKMGAPFGITYKQYFLKRFGFEIAGGWANTNLSDDDIVANFESMPEYREYNYALHEVQSGYSVQARVVMHSPLPRFLTGRGFAGLDWYFGAGAEFRILQINYVYKVPVSPIEDDFKKFDYTSKDIGPEWMVGIEYAFSEIPLSAFAEMGMFFKVNGRVSHNLQGGLGARFNF